MIKNASPIKNSVTATPTTEVINRKRLPTFSIKYIGMKVQKKLTAKSHRLVDLFIIVL